MTMQSDNIHHILQEFGLAKRESECYIALLELGCSRTGPLIKKTGIPSSKIYEILNSLEQKGLASHFVKQNIRHYQAAPPKTLISYINEKKKKIEEILPALLIKQKFTRRQNVELFEGQKAVFTLFTDLISDARLGEKYFVFSIGEEKKSEQAALFFKNLALRRKEKKLDVLVLRNAKYYKKEKHTKLRIKFTKIQVPQGITVFRDYVIMLSWKETPVAIRIQSKEFADDMKEFFMDVWNNARK